MVSNRRMILDLDLESLLISNPMEVNGIERLTGSRVAICEIYLLKAMGGDQGMTDLGSASPSSHYYYLFKMGL